MGNIISLAKESKAFLQEIPKISAAFVDVLFGTTKMLQDLEEIFIELKEISDLLEVAKETCKDNESKVLQEKAVRLLKRTKQKLFNTSIHDAKYNEIVKNMQSMMSTILDTNKDHLSS